jgi:hypothetical protein
MTDYPPCLNANCRSFGKSHPNCHCYDDTPTENLTAGGFERPGLYTKAYKGPGIRMKVLNRPDTTQPASPASYGSHGGLHAKMQESPAQSRPTYEPELGGVRIPVKIRTMADGGIVHFCDTHMEHLPSCEHYAKGGDVDTHRSVLGDPGAAVEHAVVSQGLHHVLTKTGRSRSPDPHAPVKDFLAAAKRGHAIAQSDPMSDSSRMEPDDATTRALDDYAKQAVQDPMQQLQAAPSSLGAELPAHQAQLDYQSGLTQSYLDSIRPRPTQPGPLDRTIQPTPMDREQYHRQLRLVQQPQLIYQYAKDGTLQPQDLKTVGALYPRLSQGVSAKAANALIEAKTRGEPIPYRRRVALGMILGQDLDATMTQPLMAAAMAANAPKQPQPPQGKGKGQGKASSIELNQVNKVDDLAKTPLEKRETKD